MRSKATLRQQAEDLLKKRSLENPHSLSGADSLKFINELEVHQIELEMQNEELLQAKEQAEEAIEKYTNLYDFAPTGYFTLSNTGEIIVLNLVGAKMLGKDRSNLINSRFGFFVSNETKPVFNAFLDRAFTNNGIETCEVVLLADDNRSTYVHLSGTINGKREQCLLTVTDFTERKKAEQEVKLKNEELSELNAQKDRFFSIIAHDLKSPFNSIMGFSEILVGQINENDYDGIKRYAEIILESSQRAMDLLMNLMDWTRAQTGRMEFNPEYFEIIDLIDENILLFDGIAAQKGITINRILPPKIPVFADKEMLNTVCRNLISNAIKFTKPEGEIFISAIEKQTEIMVSVSDNGVGISKTNIGKLFRIDQNYTTSGTNREQGTGLGLLLCKEFVEKHGGQIRVDSLEGIGSTFSFTLPLNAIT
jgi:signal transduction histidine kinase